jgi:NTP pyrophosphatase (non-canonical NTP hydrolase)
MDRKNELFQILSEECAETTQAISKIFRFGENSFNPKDKKKITNIKHVENEIGDVFAVLKLLIEEGHIDGERILKAAEDKLKKLNKFMANK